MAPQFAHAMYVIMAVGAVALAFEMWINRNKP